MNEKAKNFRNRNIVERIDPNIEVDNITKEQLKKFAEMFKETPNEELIAFKDSKVKELLNYILSDLIFEMQEFYPCKIIGRGKSVDSTEDKIIDWSSREEKKDKQISDAFAITIIPTEEPDILYSNGDPILKKMIKKKEENRKFILEKYEELEETNGMFTFSEYCTHCKEVLHKLIELFPPKATKRIECYNSLIEKLDKTNIIYENTFENANKKLDLKECSKIAHNINLKTLMNDFNLKYSNDTMLYVHKKNLMNIFNNSKILNAFRNICF